MYSKPSVLSFSGATYSSVFRFATFGCFLISFLVVCLRSWDAVTFPVMYAEDGVWSGKILTDGFWHTAFKAREFPVLGLVGLLQLAIGLAKISPQGIFNLPITIFIVGNTFVAIVATVAFRSIPESRSFIFRIALAAAVVLMPLGFHVNETLGRILNLGFLFPILQMLLLIPIVTGRYTRVQLASALFVSAIAGWTFPVCIGLTLWALIILSIDRVRTQAIGFSHVQIALSAILLLNALGLQLISLTSKGGANLPFTQSGLIEFALARTLLFPFIAPWYSNLSDIFVIFFFLLIVISIYLLVRICSREQNKNTNIVIIFAWGCCGIYALATIIMRIGFTHMLNGHYSTSFPDRYFYGINILVVFGILITVQFLPITYKPMRIAVPISWLILAIFSVTKENDPFPQPFTFVSKDNGTFAQQLCKQISSGGALFDIKETDSIFIPIQPWFDGNPWRMIVPRYELDRVATKDTCQYKSIP